MNENNPFAPPQTPMHAGNEPIGMLAALNAYRGWIKFCGILSIVAGAFMILSIWGIIVCWLPIWMGVLLTKAAGSLEVTMQTQDTAAANLALTNIGKYFKIMGITMLVYFALGILAVLLAIMIPLMLN